MYDLNFSNLHPSASKPNMYTAPHFGRTKTNNKKKTSVRPVFARLAKKYSSFRMGQIYDVTSAAYAHKQLQQFGQFIRLAVSPTMTRVALLSCSIA